MNSTYRPDSTKRDELEPAPSSLDELFAEMDELDEEFFRAHPNTRREDIDFDDYPEIETSSEF